MMKCINKIKKFKTSFKSTPFKYVPKEKYLSTLPTVTTEKIDDKDLPLIENDIGLKKFMSRVYKHVGIGVVSTVSLSAGIGYLIPEIDPMVLLFTIGGGMITALGGCYGIQKYNPDFRSLTFEGTMYEYADDPPMRKISFYTLVAGMGVALAPVMHIYMNMYPSVIPISLGISTFIFGSCAYIATKCKDITMMKWKAPLAIGLTALIGIQVVGLVSNLLLGNNMVSEMLHTIDVYGGIGLFTALSIYDSYIARKMYEKNQPDHLLCATTLYLDFMNLLMRIMEALERSQQKH